MIYMRDTESPDYIITIGNRKTGIHEYGDESGWPVFYFHGYPGSRLDGIVLDFNVQASKENFRVIGVDRPGIGLSDYQQGRTLLDWSSDIAAIADKLRIDTFSVVGFSGGGPYALACASAMPHRITSAAFISGMGPFRYKESKNDNAMFIPRRSKIVRRFITAMLYKVVTKLPEKLSVLIPLLPRGDREYFSKGGKKDKLLLFFSENFKQGIEGFLNESEIYRQPWGFELCDIGVPVHLWQGTADRNVSVRSSKRLSSEIPHCKTHFIDGEGHFSLPGKYFADILQGLRS
jgi:pimeloyl-ACP methyl ester carboxylesterase